jgi:DNA-binding XRE family transcriptional regulator
VSSPGRSCAVCSGPLSRYNPENVCQYCKASPAARDGGDACPMCKGMLPVTVSVDAGVGQRIAELRLARGFTQQLLADKAGLSKSIVSQLEQGIRTSAGYALLTALADMLSVPVAALFDAPGPVHAPGGNGKRRGRGIPGYWR